MLYVITRTDDPRWSHLRETVLPRHAAYIEAHRDIIVAAGAYLHPLTDEVCGSMFIVQCTDYAAATRFINEDPSTQAGIFSRIEVWPWRQREGHIDLNSPSR